MTRSARRRRGALLVALALAAGGLASSRVARREHDLETRTGAPVPVVVAAADLPAGRRIGGANTARLLAVRRVPARFAPPDALTAPQEAEGAELAAPVPAGGYVTAGALAGGDPAPDGEPRPPRRGERAVELAVSAGDELRDAPAGARVDVLVTSDREGRGRTYLALEDVELLGARPNDSEDARGAADGAAAHSNTLARVRVSVRQAVFLAAAESFAREITLLLRGPGERSRSGPLSVDAGSI